MNLKLATINRGRTQFTSNTKIVDGVWVLGILVHSKRLI